MSPYKPKRQRRSRGSPADNFLSYIDWDQLRQPDRWARLADRDRESIDRLARVWKAVFRHTRAGTRTEAPTKRMSQVGPAIVGGEMTESSWSDFRQADPMARRQIEEMVGDITVWDNFDGVLENGPGEQAIFTLGDTNRANFLTNSYGNFGIGDLTTLYTKLQASYPEELLDENNAAIYNETGAMYIREMVATHDFCNMSNQMVWFDLYELVKSQTDRIDNPALDERLQFYPPLLWKTGLLEQAGPIGSPQSYLDVGSVPFSSKRFCQDWYVKKVTKVCLGPGDLHRHTVTWAPNSIVQFADFQRPDSTDTLSSIATAMKGLTHYTMIVMHGQVCCSLTTGRATYGPGKLCYVQTRRLKVQFGLGHQAPIYSDLANVKTVATTVMNQDTANAEQYEEAG